MWLMSPPCQPFTRNNTTESRDTNDPRAKAFENIIDMIPKLRMPPQYLALEVGTGPPHYHLRSIHERRMLLVLKNLIVVKISFAF
jgi:hypothetical protein